MFSRQSMFKLGLGPLLKSHSLNKVENVAFMHLGCPNLHISKLTLPTKEFLRSSRNVFGANFQTRYESTSISKIVETIESVDPIPDPPAPVTEVLQSATESLAEPTFASLGLGGYWPSGWVQTALEFLHVDCGLPWWGAIVCGTLVVRILMFPVVVKSQRNVAKMNNNMPQLTYLQAKVTEARQRGDRIEAARQTALMAQFLQEKDVNPLKNMLVPLIQAPVFISVFVGLRAMANLPVESMKTGGALWFVDLTMPDQFYLLPLITSATFFCTLKLGVDSGVPSQNTILMKYVLNGMPLIMFPFITGFPGAMLVYWVTSNFISLAQVGILKIPQVREFCKIEKKIPFNKDKLPIKDKGFVNNLKDAWTNMKITGELEQRERLDKMAFMKAGREPIVKTYKYDPTQVRQKSSSATSAKKLT